MATLILSGVGCVQMPSGLKVMDGGEQEDFPVPRSFELERSFVPDDRLEASFRSWQGYYSGHGEVQDLVPWYVREMGNHQWRFKGVRDVNGSRKNKKLIFEKGDEVSLVHIYEEMGHGMMVTRVYGKIGPRGPEEFTVEEHLRPRAAAGEVKPVSFSLRDGEARPERGTQKGAVTGVRDPAEDGRVKGRPARENPIDIGSIEDDPHGDEEAEETPPASRHPEDANDLGTRYELEDSAR
ncbi:MAG TPA: hypothetical protein VMT52_06775 [Planctomycetota bacterium]|nr:hypothetical protein [Planctomycetota bacterium]